MVPGFRRVAVLAVTPLAAVLATAPAGAPAMAPAMAMAPAWAAVPSVQQVAASSAARRCASPPAAAPIIAEPPWTQQRYDVATLSQINDGSGVIVAVLDSGVDATHPQLAGAVTAGEDMLLTHGDGREDCLGHGTAVASIIAARPVAGSGLRGLAPGATILPIRVSERAETDGVVTGDGDVAELVAGITAAVNRRPRPGVLNLSIATGADNPALRQAVAAALAADIVVVAAAGNQYERGNPLPFPASYPGVIGVGAIAPDNVRLASSQTGSHVDLVAPGDQVVVAAPGGGHLRAQGTSFATAFVSATAALIRARWPSLDRIGVERRLLATVDPAAGGRDDYGAGVVNPLRALTEVLAPAAAVNSPSPGAVADQRAVSETDVTPGRGRPRSIVAALVLLLGAAGVAGIALATPAGRRRGWRPGRITRS